MYSVRLLPSEYRIAHQSVRKSGISLLAAIGVMGALLVVYLILSVSAASKSNELSALQYQNDVMAMRITELEGLDVLYNDVSKQLADVLTAAGSNPSWDKLIATVGNSVPASIGMDNLIMRYSSEKKECMIQGTVSNHLELSNWMDKLEELDLIENPLCTSTSLSDTGSGIKFEVTFTIKPGSGYLLPTEVSSNDE